MPSHTHTCRWTVHVLLCSCRSWDVRVCPYVGCVYLLIIVLIQSHMLTCSYPLLPPALFKHNTQVQDWMQTLCTGLCGWTLQGAGAVCLVTITHSQLAAAECSFSLQIEAAQLPHLSLYYGCTIHSRLIEKGSFWKKDFFISCECMKTDHEISH